METITFTCEVITPMFLAGADGVTPEIRPASIKGALRFWWRAMNGHLKLEDTKDENGTILQKGLRTREAEIFGGAGEGMRKSRIIIRVANENITLKQNRLSGKIKYLAYGCENRQYIEVGSKFDLVISINGESSVNTARIKEEIAVAFSLLSYLGGIGAKSRNGFGAFSATNILPFSDLIEKIQSIETEPSLFTSFSRDCQIFVSNDARFDNWRTAIEQLCDLYKNQGKAKVPKKFRGHIAAPYSKCEHPERHAKLFLMSVFKEEGNEGEKIKICITYLPYDYLNSYPELHENERQKLVSDWKIATKNLKEGLTQARNSKKKKSLVLLK